MTKKKLIALLILSVIIIPILIIGNIQLYVLEEQAKSLNIPLNVKSMKELYDPDKDSQKVTFDFLEALKHMFPALSMKEIDNLCYYNLNGKKYNKKNAQKFIIDNSKFLEGISSIDNFKAIRFPIDYVNPNCTNIFLNTAKVMDARLIIVAKLRLNISNRDVNSAVSSLDTLLDIGDSTLHNPFYIGFLSYNSATLHWNYCFQETIKRIQLPQNALLEIIKKLDKRENNLKTNYIKLLNGATFVFFHLVNNNNPTNIEGKNIRSIDSFSLKNIKKNKFYVPWFIIGGVFEKKAILSDVIYIRQKLLDFEDFSKNKTSWIKFDKQSKSHTLAPFYNKHSTYYKSYLQTLNCIISVRKAKITAAVLLCKMKYKKSPKQIRDLSPEFINLQTMNNPKTGKFFNLKDILEAR